VAALQAYLTSNRTFTKPELLKLWKGLFYCFWLSDRPRPQQALANTLSSSLLLQALAPSTAITFYRAFWETMAREWNGVDALRVDKFLLLARRFVGGGFRYCCARGGGSSGDWDAEAVERLLVRNLEETVLHPANQKMPAGLRLHLADVWVDEIEKVLELPGGDEVEAEAEAERRKRVAAVPWGLLLRPWEKMRKEGAHKLWRTKAKEVLMDERLREWGYGKEGEGEEGGGEEWTGFDD